MSSQDRFRRYKRPPSIEWPFETRAVIRSYMKIADLYAMSQNIQPNVFLPVDETMFKKCMNDQGITVEYVQRTTGINVNPGSNYWVLSFKSARQAALFRLKYSEIFN